MQTKLIIGTLAVMLAAVAGPRARSAPGDIAPVTVDNFNRAESDMYFASAVDQAGGVGKFPSSPRGHGDR